LEKVSTRSTGELRGGPPGSLKGGKKLREKDASVRGAREKRKRIHSGSGLNKEGWLAEDGGGGRGRGGEDW